MRRSLILAALAAASVFTWQCTTVHVNYGGNWTALFHIGERTGHAESIMAGAYVFPNSRGYDGQMYRMTAHDPWLQTGLIQAADAPAMRYRRILVPVLAWLLAAGNPKWIDGAYVGVILLFVFAGTFATSEWLRRQGLRNTWALAFPLLPGSLITIDRMTVDVALYALIAGLLLFWERSNRISFVLLALCPLVRDLGLLVIGAAVLCAIYKRSLGRVVLWGSAAVPVAAWFAWVRVALPAVSGDPNRGEVPRWLFSAAGYGIFIAMLRPFPYALSPSLTLLTQGLDILALSGIVVAVVTAFVVFPWRRPELPDCIMLLFAALYFVSSATGFWKDAFSYPRAFTPLLALLAWKGLQTRRAWEALPLLAVMLRVGWQLGGQVEGIVRAVLPKSL